MAPLEIPEHAFFNFYITKWKKNIEIRKFIMDAYTLSKIKTNVLELWCGTGKEGPPKEAFLLLCDKEHTHSR
jgi:hypothetical protein